MNKRLTKPKARVRRRLRSVVGNRVKCKACGHDIHIDHFAGVCGGDFYCDSIPCLIVLSDRISNARREFPAASAGKLHGVVGSLDSET